MKVLVCPHELAMGGSQISAVELACALGKLGHEVVVHAPDGILSSFVADQGLPLIVSPAPSSVVSLRAIGAMSKVVRRGGFDLVHAYEWAPSVRAAFGPNLRWNTPTVMTVLSMEVPDFLPRHVPMIVGTRSLAESESSRRSDVHLIEPPIDTDLNRSSDVRGARAEFGFDDDELVLSIVCRISPDLDKLAGVLEAIAAVDSLAVPLRARLVVAGDGVGLDEVRVAASAVNARHACTVIVVTGPLLDPRPAYEAADIVLGMGSSALKGMSFAKPTVVQGTSGFWKLLDESSLDRFLHDGWFGHRGGGTEALRRIIVELSRNASRRVSLGVFGRDVVEAHYSLGAAAATLLAIYEDAIARSSESTGRAASLLRCGVEVAKFRTVVALRRIFPSFLVSAVPA